MKSFDFLNFYYFDIDNIYMLKVSFEVHNQKTHINYHRLIHFHKILKKLVLLILRNLNECLILNNILLLNKILIKNLQS